MTQPQAESKGYGGYLWSMHIEYMPEAIIWLRQNAAGKVVESIMRDDQIFFKFKDLTIALQFRSAFPDKKRPRDE